MLERQREKARMAAAEAALQRIPWRRMSEGAVALRLAEALDGAPVAADDSRVVMVEHALRACPWRRLSLAEVGAQAARALDTWSAGLCRLESELEGILSGHH